MFISFSLLVVYQESSIYPLTEKRNFPFFSREYFYEVIFSLHCGSAVKNPFSVD